MLSTSGSSSWKSKWQYYEIMNPVSTWLLLLLLLGQLLMMQDDIIKSNKWVACQSIWLHINSSWLNTKQTRKSCNPNPNPSNLLFVLSQEQMNQTTGVTSTLNCSLKHTEDSSLVLVCFSFVLWTSRVTQSSARDKQLLKVTVFSRVRWVV